MSQKHRVATLLTFSTNTDVALHRGNIFLPRPTIFDSSFEILADAGRVTKTNFSANRVEKYSVSYDIVDIEVISFDRRSMKHRRAVARERILLGSYRETVIFDARGIDSAIFRNCCRARNRTECVASKGLRSFMIFAMNRWNVRSGRQGSSVGKRECAHDADFRQGVPELSRKIGPFSEQGTLLRISSFALASNRNEEQDERKVYSILFYGIVRTYARVPISFEMESSFESRMQNLDIETKTFHFERRDISSSLLRRISGIL